MSEFQRAGLALSRWVWFIAGLVALNIEGKGPEGAVLVGAFLVCEHVVAYGGKR